MKKVNLIIILTAIALYTKGQTKIQFTEIRPPYKSISPTVRNLLHESNNPGFNVSGFWDTMNKKKMPIIDTDPLYPDYAWVTLIYRDSTSHKEISFEVFGIYSEYRLGDMKMHKLENTDIYYRSYMIPNDLCFSYRFKIRDTISDVIYRDIDKYNKNLIPTGKQKGFSYSVLDLRANEPDWNTKVDSTIIHKMDTLGFESKILKNKRNVFVYLPPGYNPERKKGYPIIYLFDAFIYLNRVEAPNILDNLISKGKINPMVAVLIDNPTRTSRMTELPLNSNFKDAMISELIPLIKDKYNVTSNPNETIIGGMSYGGLAAAYISFYHPDIFGKVLSQSGGSWRGIELTDNFGNEVRNDWLINQFIIERQKPIKLYLDWGLQENMVLGANRKFVRVLNEKGYHYKFIEFNGWHDWSNSRKTFPGGLIYLLE